MVVFFFVLFGLINLMCQLISKLVDWHVLKRQFPLLLEGVPVGRGSDINITAQQYGLF